MKYRRPARTIVAKATTQNERRGAASSADLLGLWLVSFSITWREQSKKGVISARPSPTRVPQKKMNPEKRTAKGWPFPWVP